MQNDKAIEAAELTVVSDWAEAIYGRYRISEFMVREIAKRAVQCARPMIEQETEERLLISMGIIEGNRDG